MWTTPEDGRRYEELTSALERALSAKADLRRWDLVDLGDLMAFLEWMELAREAAPSLRPFVEKSSPHLLQRFSYAEMMHDFRYLRSQLTVAGEASVPGA